jgi:ketosteroid isomerase-like protein
MSADDLELAEAFRRAAEEALRTGDREPVYALLAEEVEWVIPQRPLEGIGEVRERLVTDAPQTSLEVSFEGDWVDRGGGHLTASVREVWRLRRNGEFAYERHLDIDLRIRDGKIVRYEMKYGR